MKKLKVFENADEFIKGGDASGKDISTLDEEEVQVGSLVEMEHTDNPEVAKEIATDHISKISDYYHRLILAGLVDEQPALDLAKSFGWEMPQ